MDKVKTKHGILAPKQRVTLSWDTERRGVIVTLGLEVSEIKFGDGAFRFIQNRDIVPAKEK